MDIRSDESVHTSIRQTAVHMGLSVIVFFVLLVFICSIVGVNNSYPQYDMKDYNNITYQITRSDGTEDTYHRPYFPPMHKGDRLMITIPALAARGFDHAAVILRVYHCRVRVMSGSEVIYRQTSPSDGCLIGQRTYMVALPSGYQQSDITISAITEEGGSVNNINDLRIVPIAMSVYSLQASKTPVVLMLLALLVVDLFMFCLSIVISIKNRHLSTLLFSALFSGCTVCWYMGYDNLYMTFMDNGDFAATIEYIALTLVSAPLQAYMALELKKKPLRIISTVMAVFAFAAFGIITVLNFTDNGISYVDFSKYVRIYIAICLVFDICSAFTDWRSKNSSRGILQGGLGLTMIIAFVELVRFYLCDIYGDRYTFLHFSLIPYALVVLMLTILLYYGVRVANESVMTIEKESLERLAYVDQLTGAPNRSSCYREIDRMKDQNRKDFVFVFIDINFLKLTNDTWGHTKGDELIRTASNLLKKYFSEDGFYGRWGGDEFIACHFGSLEETEHLMDNISRDIDTLNASGRFDFNMSESWGYGVSTSDHPLTPEQAINMADEAMYTEKVRIHAQRTDGTSASNSDR